MFRRTCISLVMIFVGAASALAGFAPAAAAPVTPALAGAPANPPAYVDNRSDAVSLLISYFNAVDRQEYARAYGYWEAGSPVGGFSQFVAGFAATQAVAVTTGPVGGSAGAGQRYFVVPVTLQATTNSGQQTFVGCYVLHLAQPELQAVPPFHPLSIASAQIVPVTSGANADTLRAQACTAAGLNGTSSVAITPTPGEPESGAQFYIDSRTGPLDVLQSLFNAINRREYARAYGYWEPSASLPAFSSFQQGYANTQAVQWTFGGVSSNSGAGQLYYSVPATLRAQTTGGLQTFVGCYVLHLADPSLQTQPPYQPVGIRSANLAQVANTANTSTLMARACQSTAPAPSAPIHLSFAVGTTSATVAGSVPAGGVQDYTLFAGVGQWLFVDFGAAQPNVTVQILTSGGRRVGQTAPGATHWQGLLPATGEYRVRVISTGSAAAYSLTLTIPRRISFARGAISATTPGSVVAGSMTSYVLRARSGQTMTASLNPNATGVWLEIYDLTGSRYLLNISAGATQWTGRLPATGDYLVRAVSTGPAAAFNLSVTIK